MWVPGSWAVGMMGCMGVGELGAGVLTGRVAGVKGCVVAWGCRCWHTRVLACWDVGVLGCREAEM